MKIAIPREALSQIMDDYNCTEEEAAKAYLDAQDRANESFKAHLAKRLGPLKTSVGKITPKIYTPKEIKSHLDKYVDTLFAQWYEDQKLKNAVQNQPARNATQTNVPDPQKNNG